MFLFRPGLGQVQVQGSGCAAPCCQTTSVPGQRWSLVVVLGMLLEWWVGKVGIAQGRCGFQPVALSLMHACPDSDPHLVVDPYCWSKASLSVGTATCPVSS